MAGDSFSKADWNDKMRGKATRDYHADTPQVAEMKAEMNRGPLVNPPTAMSDQAIRAHALECVCTLMTIPDAYKKVSAGNFWEDVHMFEAYIRDGVT